MTHASGKFSIFLAVALTGLASACTATPGWQDSYTDKRNDVTLVRLTHDVRFESGTARLPAGERDALHQFLADNGAGYGDTVWIDQAGGTMAQSRRATLTAALEEGGVIAEPRDLAYGAAPPADAARVILGRYVVTPPECPDWRKPANRDYANTASSNYGCATVTNLGMMVADPRDLLAGRDHGGADAEVSAKAVERYRSGNVEETQVQGTQSGGGSQ